MRPAVAPVDPDSSVEAAIANTGGRDLGFLVPKGGHKNNSRGYYHLARSIESFVNSSKRFVITVDNTNMTNLCDFRIGSADYSATPPEGYTICQVCNSRQNRGL